MQFLVVGVPWGVSSRLLSFPFPFAFLFSNTILIASDRGIAVKKRIFVIGRYLKFSRGFRCLVLFCWIYLEWDIDSAGCRVTPYMVFEEAPSLYVQSDYNYVLGNPRTNQGNALLRYEN